MKIIDLLNKIANGKIPKKIIFNGYEYLYHDKEHGYCRSGYDSTYICLNSEYYLFDILNDKVEIVEEDKGIEKIKIDNEDRIQALSTGNYVYKVNQPTKNIINKINEIIDYLMENKQ